jgi:hypothetical protein
MAGHSRPKDGVASAGLCPAMAICLPWRPEPRYFVSGTFFRLPCYLPALSNRGLEMSENYIIEIGSQAAGIVVRNPDGYRFFAATHRFNPLEGQLFLNAREAERAVRRLANGELTVAA